MRIIEYITSCIEQDDMSPVKQELIRCKDCKFFKTQFNEDGYYTTNCQFSKVAEVNGFCHMARRKEE